MQILSDKGKTNEWLNRIGILSFYLALIMEVVIVLVDKSNYINPIESYLFRITFMLCCMKILTTSYTLKEWIAVAAMGGIGVCAYYITGNNDVLRVIVFLAAFKGINLEKAAKVVFWLTLLGTVLIAGMSLTGIYGQVAVTDYFRGGTGYKITRYCFGMGHPNAFHCMAWALLTLGLFLYNKYCKWWHYLVLFIANILLFAFTDSKSGVIVCVLTIAFALIIRKKEIFDKKIFAVFCMTTFLACIIFSVGIACFDIAPDYDGTFWWKINTALTGRIQWAQDFGKISTWSLFSTEGNGEFFDMGWIRMFYWYGILPGVLFVIANILVIRECLQKRRAEALLVILMFSVYTVFEAHAISSYIGRNYVLLLIGAYWCEVIPVNTGMEYSVGGILCHMLRGRTES